MGMLNKLKELVSSEEENNKHQKKAKNTPKKAKKMAKLKKTKSVKKTTKSTQNQQINQQILTQTQTFPTVQQLHSQNNQQTQQEIQHFDQNMPQIGQENYSDMVSEWEKQVTLVKQHPLSQVRVINATLLDTLTEVLKSMDGKLTNLGKLDDILGILKDTKHSLSQKGISSRKLDDAIKEIEDITIKDEQVIKILMENGKKTANEISKELGITRSTASLRLNKLYASGILDKKPSGKKIFFVYKSD
ncbi:MAG: winged helix-turn-helix transcriptional regulator [Candidatus Nanoarchaeia archaeon]|nr:winged helix-turn-helix transcriptional regulator [Candidatus Nanoarchaeia archaeon]